MVGVRKPPNANICCLVRANFAGRITAFAAMIVKMTCGYVNPLDPNWYPRLGLRFSSRFGNSLKTSS